MEGVVPRRRGCLGESRRVLEGGRSMSPKGGKRGRRKMEVEALGGMRVVEFTLLR